jgi:hypothetical protein
MAKRLVLWVVLPFIALSVIGFWLTQREASTPIAPEPTLPVRLPAPAPVAAKRPSPTPIGDGITRALIEARPGSNAELPPAARAAIEALRPMIDQCFADVASRYPGPQRVSLNFTVRATAAAGALVGGAVSGSTIPDPFLESCFLEAIEDAKFPPALGGDNFRVSSLFTYPR